MARRNKRSSGDDDFARALAGLVLLGLLALAWKFGLLAMISNFLVGLLRH